MIGTHSTDQEVVDNVIDNVKTAIANELNRHIMKGALVIESKRMIITRNPQGLVDFRWECEVQLRDQKIIENLREENKRLQAKLLAVGKAMED